MMCWFEPELKTNDSEPAEEVIVLVLMLLWVDRALALAFVTDTVANALEGWNCSGHRACADKPHWPGYGRWWTESRTAGDRFADVGRYGWS